MDPVEVQLISELQADVARGLRSRRPLLTHLNADTTWLISLPIPVDTASPKSRKRKRSASSKQYFHILVDPWLRGSQSDVADFFSQQWHRVKSAVQTVAEIEDVIAGIEEVAESVVTDAGKGGGRGRGAIDAVVVSHEFTDHMHKATLLEVNKAVPVFATPVAVGRIKAWGHFDTVVKMPYLTARPGGCDWKETSLPPLPSWIGISRLASEKIEMEAMLYYHSAVMVAFDTGSGGPEAIIYTPHGISPEDLRPVAMASPKVKTLALLHGLHNVRLGSQLNMGAHNGLKAQRFTGAKYWVSTHDEIKRGGGLVSWFLRRDALTLKDALEKEIQQNGDAKKDSELKSLEGVHFADLGNGESMILE